MYFEKFLKGQTMSLPSLSIREEMTSSELHLFAAIWDNWLSLGYFGEELLGMGEITSLVWGNKVSVGDEVKVDCEVLQTNASAGAVHGVVTLVIRATNRQSDTVVEATVKVRVRKGFPHSKEGFIAVEGGNVWYRVVGDGEKTPLIVLHGGPGSAHFGMDGLGVLGSERKIIFYDQLGCGHSDRPSDMSLWTTERFVRELHTLRTELGLHSVHILGHSWGTMLLADYLLEHADGVKSAIFSSPCLSAIRWVEDANRYRAMLPSDVQKILTECEESGTTNSEAYEKATEVYMQRHVCRVKVPELSKPLRKAAFGEVVYNTMWGPSEFYPTGSLKTYDRTPNLPDLKVSSLFTCGEYDEATPGSTEYYHSLVPDSEYQVLPDCSHSPLREQPNLYLETIRKFLEKVDEQYVD